MCLGRFLDSPLNTDTRTIRIIHFSVSPWCIIKEMQNYRYNVQDTSCLFFLTLLYTLYVFITDCEAVQICLVCSLTILFQIRFGIYQIHSNEDGKILPALGCKRRKGRSFSLQQWSSKYNNLKGSCSRPPWSLHRLLLMEAHRSSNQVHQCYICCQVDMKQSSLYLRHLQTGTIRELALCRISLMCTNIWNRYSFCRHFSVFGSFHILRTKM